MVDLIILLILHNNNDSMKKDQQTLRHEQKTSEELLMEIRNLLTNKQDEQHHGFLANHDIDHLLKDSFKKTEQLQKKEPKNHHQHKIEHISNVLQNQQNFIQNYAKEKIRSEVFSSLRQNISEREMSHYQRHRQELLRQREIEEAEERERQNKVIESTKKFLKYEGKNLPYKEINEFMMKEGEASLPYLLNQTAQSATASINNKINEQKTDLQSRYQEQKLSKVESSHNSSPNKIHEVSMEEEKIEIFDDDHTMNESYVREQAEIELQETLKRQPKFLRAFKYFLLNQINLHKFLDEEPPSERNRSSTKRSEGIFKYPNKPNLYTKEPKVETIGELLSKYKVKGIVLKDMGLRSIVKQTKPICQKVVSKMNGQSFIFHPKKVVLTDKQLVWCEEKEEPNESSKRANLIIQDIVVSRTKKEEGGFFSKTTTDIDIVHVKGSNRDIKFEKNYLEGADVYEQLCNLMASKVYHLNVVVGCQVNEELKKFVTDKKAEVLNFSNQFLQSHEKYPNKDYRLMIVKIFAALFETRKEVTSINLTSCKLNILEINTFVKQFNHFTKVQKIVISETKFNPETMIVLSKYISSLTTENLEVVLPTCLIDDNIIIKAKEHFIKCTNISILNLSMNDFTMQGFTVLIDLCSEPQCILSQLNVSACKINNIVSVGQLVKKAKKLQVLRADDCGLSFESSKQMSQFFQCCRNSKLKKISLLQNDIVNNLKPFQDFWLNDTPKEIMVNLGIFNEKTSKNLQGKLL